MSQRFKNKEERLQYWIQHSRKFAASLQTLKEYCAEQTISHHTFSYWRSEIKKEQSERSAVKVPQSKFVPVKIAQPLVRQGPIKNIKEFPDAKWVADFLRHFLQGSL